ncbi:MAG: hypothetical protein ABDH28_02050 [Brevinematia bacterium]
MNTKELKLLLTLITLIMFPVLGTSFTISKPKVLYDRSANVILVMLFIEKPSQKNLSEMIRKNLDVSMLVEVKLMRKDFGILNIQTEITNVILEYKLSYDLVTERYTVHNPYTFKSYESLESLFELFYPLLVKIDLHELKGNPDFEEIYETTEFFISSRAKIIYMNVKPPLNIIVSLIGLGNYESEVAVSDMFKIK